MPYKSVKEQVKRILDAFDFAEVAAYRKGKLTAAELRTRAHEILFDAHRSWHRETREQMKLKERHPHAFVGPIRISEDGFVVQYDGLYFRLAYCLDEQDGFSLDNSAGEKSC